VALGTYKIRIVCVVVKLLLHAWPQLSIFGKDPLAPRAMWPKQITFRLMMGFVGGWGTMANERHHSHGQECPNTVNGLRAGSGPTSDQYQVVPAVSMGRIETAGAGPWGS
jgi:hypothetical protein